MFADNAQFSDIFDLETPPDLSGDGVVAIVLCHNEALRLPHFLEFHKAAGVTRFLVVDNASDDGSSEILENDPAVVRFPSSAAYSECKSLWREVLADLYCRDRWTLFPDVDELFVHPDWPGSSVGAYCRKLEDAGADCLLTIMVDMYPDGDLSDAKYTAGDAFLDAAPFFDTGNYRLESYSRSSLRDWPTPPVRVRGGARERLFYSHVIHDGTWLDRALCRTFFGLDRALAPSGTERWRDRLLGKWINRRNSGIGLPNMSKVALMRWRQGGKFAGGVHRMDQRMNMAPDVGTLLHFKYFDDFGNRAHYLAARGQHTDGGAHYALYSSQGAGMNGTTVMSPQSRRFDGVESLIAAGLMRNALGARG